MYNEKTDTLEIMKIKRNGRGIACTTDAKYGITIKMDIEENPRVIVIPEASVLFGVEPLCLSKFASDFN